MEEFRDTASLTGIVSFGSQLATTLQTFVETTQKPRNLERLFELVLDVNSTASSLKQLQDLLNADNEAQDEPENRTVFTTEGRQEVMMMIDQCGKLYTTIVLLLTKAGTAGGRGKVTLSLVDGKMLKATSLVRISKWSWLEPRIKRCQEQLRWLKMSLLFTFQLASLARFQVSTIQRTPGDFEEELGMRTMAEMLRLQKMKFTAYLITKNRRSERTLSIVSSSRTSSVVHIPHFPTMPSTTDVMPDPDIFPPFPDLDTNSTPSQENETGIPFSTVAGRQNDLKDFGNIVIVPLRNEAMSSDGRIVDQRSENMPVVFEVSNRNSSSLKGLNIDDEKSSSESSTLKNSDCESNFEYQSPGRSSTKQTAKEIFEKTSNGNSKNREPESLSRVEAFGESNSEQKGTSKDAEITRTVPGPSLECKFVSWIHRIRIFGSRDRFLKDRESQELEAYIILKDSQSFKIPFGHQRLTFGLKVMTKKRNASFLEPFVLLHPHFHNSLSQTLDKAKRSDGRERTCLAFQVFKNCAVQGKPIEQLVVFFSLGNPAEPILKLKDAVGRKFSFPFEKCSTWAGIEDLIKQAFLHVTNLSQHVIEGHYDLIGPTGDIILPQIWEDMIQPGRLITMHMWPIPESRPPPMPPLSPMMPREPPRPFNFGPPPHIGIIPFPRPRYGPGPPPPSGVRHMMPPRTPRHSAKEKAQSASAFQKLMAASKSKNTRRRRYGFGRYDSESDYSDSDSDMSLVSDSEIEDEPEDLGIKIDFEKQENENKMGLGELLAKWTNAIDIQMDNLCVSDSNSDSDASSSSSLSDD